MSLENYRTMDPFMLLSMVNMYLRDNNESLIEFCKRNEIDKLELENILAKVGFTYNEISNQFK
jgi:hypothetical protein